MDSYKYLFATADHVQRAPLPFASYINISPGKILYIFQHQTCQKLNALPKKYMIVTLNVSEINKSWKEEGKKKKIPYIVWSFTKDYTFCLAGMVGSSHLLKHSLYKITCMLQQLKKYWFFFSFIISVHFSMEWLQNSVCSNCLCK